MKNTLALLLLIFVAMSCHRDRKKETISNYVRAIWRIRSDAEFNLTKMEEVKTITAKDSLEILMKEYTTDSTQLPLDTILAHIGEDIAYNTRLLAKATRKIDSLEKAKKTLTDGSVLNDYIKTFVDLKNFTATQLDELKFEKYSLARYHEDEDAVLTYQVRCAYKIMGHSADTTSKFITQTFFLSPDTRKIYAVK